MVELIYPVVLNPHRSTGGTDTRLSRGNYLLYYAHALTVEKVEEVVEKVNT